MDLSIVIVNWNTCAITLQCLASIYDHVTERQLEVIVIDNASSDSSVEMIKEQYPQVVLIENEINRGFAAANNQGIEIAGGRYVLLLNSDTIVRGETLEKVVEFAEKRPDSAVIGCRVLNADESLQPTCSELPSLWDKFFFAFGLTALFPKSRLFARERMLWWPHDTVRSVGAVCGCFMLVRSEAIAAVGPLDERFFMYCEEIDWCKRFHDAGWKVLFYPDAEIIHLGGVSAKRYGARRARLIDQSYVRYMFKHWTRFKAYLGVCSMMLFYILRLIVHLPFKCFGKHREAFENHWQGLCGLIHYRRYLMN